MTDPEEAATHPELAVMSVMVHGRERPVVEAFVAVLEFVKPEHAPQYYEYAYRMAAPAVRRILGEIMASTDWPVYSPFAREHYGRGKDEGLAEGQAKGETAGRAKGETEGRAKGEAEAVLRVLAARRIEVPEEARVRISACADLRQLRMRGLIGPSSRRPSRSCSTDARAPKAVASDRDGVRGPRACPGPLKIPRFPCRWRVRGAAPRLRAQHVQ